jgi:hypothetical protein
MSDNVIGLSADSVVAGVNGENTGIGPGVHGKSISGRGVVAESDTNYGLRCASRTLSGLRSSSVDGRGIEGESTNSDAILGSSHGPGNGVIGISVIGTGVHGQSGSGRGVVGESDTNYGVRCASRTLSGLRASSINGRGIEGSSIHSDGILGTCEEAGAGVTGISKNGIGVHGIGGLLAGKFDGNVEVSGDIKLTGGNDVAEHFSVININTVSPGCVMTFQEDGFLEVCNKSYDKKVAGVISGAGDFKPGLLLGKIETEADRMPIALMGKVFCWVDADFGAIAVGDLLTTSSTIGHAMKAGDPFKAFGSVIGKALKPLTAGKALIPVLVSLQ